MEKVLSKAFAQNNCKSPVCRNLTEGSATFMIGIQNEADQLELEDAHLQDTMLLLLAISLYLLDRGNGRLIF